MTTEPARTAFEQWSHVVAYGAAGVCIANDDAMALRRSSPGVYPTFTTELPPPAPPLWHPRALALPPARGHLAWQSFCCWTRNPLRQNAAEPV